MILRQAVEQLNLEIAIAGDLDQEITGGYASDLLSCAMAALKAGNVWVTLQAHPNVIAVASLAELSAVIITEGAEPDQQTLSKAREEHITVLRTPLCTYNVVGELVKLGIKGTDRR